MSGSVLLDRELYVLARSGVGLSSFIELSVCEAVKERHKRRGRRLDCRKLL